MLHKSKPKISDAAPKWFTQYAVFSIYYCGLYSLHTSKQTLFEPLKLSEKYGEDYLIFQPQISTRWLKNEKSDNRHRSHNYIFFQLVKKNYFWSHIQQKWSLSNHHKSQKNYEKNNAILQSHLCARWLKRKIKIADTTMKRTTQPQLLSVRGKKENYFENLIKQQRSLSNHHKFQSNYDKHEVVF